MFGRKKKCTDETVFKYLKNRQFEEATTCIYNLYFNYVIKVLHNTGCKDEHLGIEIFHDSILVLIEYFRQNKFKYDKASGFKSFLSRTAKNKCSNNLRDNKKNDDFDDGKEIEIINFDNISDEITDKERKLKIIFECIDKLNEMCRDIIELFYFDKYKQVKIAKILGILKKLRDEAVANGEDIEDPEIQNEIKAEGRRIIRYQKYECMTLLRNCIFNKNRNERT